MEILLVQVGVNSRGQPQRDQRRVAGPTLRIGRATGSGLLLPDPRVARLHAELTVGEDGARIEAREGALAVNGRPTRSAALEVGDRVELGPYQLEVEAPPAGLPLALAIRLVTPLPAGSGDLLRAALERPRQLSKRRLSYLGLLAALLLCLLLPLGPDLLGLPRLSSPAVTAVLETLPKAEPGAGSAAGSGTGLGTPGSIRPASAAPAASKAGMKTAAAGASAAAVPATAAASAGKFRGPAGASLAAPPDEGPREAMLRSVSARLLETWNPGPLSQGHQVFGADCNACHQKPFVQVRDEACQACHRVGDHVPADRLTGPAGHAFGETRCAECHRDHKGTHLAIRSQDQCADCHRDVRQVAAQAGSENVTDFLDQHPAFRISLRDAGAAGQPGPVRRVRQATPMPAEMSEHSGLKFNHALHLDPGGVRDPDGRRKATGVRDAQGRRTVLDCGSCHQPAEGGRTMAPVSMEKHCQSCHSLAFEPSVTSRQAVHGKDTEVATMLREFYARLVLGDVPEGVHPPADLPRMRPGAVLTAEDRRQALALADRKAQQVLRELFETREVCSTCHEVQRKDSARQAGWAVAPVRISTTWMPQAAFTHAKHTTEKCSTCHDVSRSKTSADVAMPTIATCRDCHVGARPVAGKVRSDCATCHGYHAAAHPTGASP